MKANIDFTMLQLLIWLIALNTTVETKHRTYSFPFCSFIVRYLTAKANVRSKGYSGPKPEENPQGGKIYSKGDEKLLDRLLQGYCSLTVKFAFCIGCFVNVILLLLYDNRND